MDMRPRSHVREEQRPGCDPWASGEPLTGVASPGALTSGDIPVCHKTAAQVEQSFRLLKPNGYMQKATAMSPSGSSSDGQSPPFAAN
jgi:hypothetical protein